MPYDKKRIISVNKYFNKYTRNTQNQLYKTKKSSISPY
jgi:hypothetical protein